MIDDDERYEETRGEARWERFQKETFNRPAHDILLQTLQYFDEFTGYSIDLGCGAGRDTMELLRRGWEVLAIDNNPYSFDKIKSKLDDKQLVKLETKKESFEELKLPKADLINASFSIPFCNPKCFDKFWTTIRDAINVNGRFSGNFLGDRDGWINNTKMTFFNKKGVLELFDGFQIEYFEEREYDSKTTEGNLKHFHLFNVIAKKSLEV